MHLIAGYKQRTESGYVVLIHPITGREVQLRKEESLVLPFVNAAKSVAMVAERARDSGTELPEPQLHALLIRLQVSGFLRLEAQQTLQPQGPDTPWAEPPAAFTEDHAVTVQRSVDLAMALAEAPVQRPVEDDRPTSVDIDVKQLAGVPGLTPYTSGSYLSPELRPKLKPALKFKPLGSGRVEVTDPDSGTSYSIDEREVEVAQRLDGNRTMSELVKAKGMLATEAQLESVVRQWRAFGFLAPFGDGEDGAYSLVGTADLVALEPGEVELSPRPRRRRSRWRWLLDLAGLVVVGVIGMRLIEVPLRVVEPCVVIPTQRHQLRSDAEGMLLSVEAKDGQRVKAGELLFTFDDREPLAQLAKLDAEVLAADAMFTRIKAALVLPEPARQRLLSGPDRELERAQAVAKRTAAQLKKRRATAAKLEAAEAAVSAAREAVAEAQLIASELQPDALAARSAGLERLKRLRAEQAGRVARLKVQSPITGTVNIPGLKERAGQRIEAGTQLGEVVDLSSVVIELRLEAQQPQLVEVGQAVVFRPASDPARVFNSRVESIRPAEEVGDPPGHVRAVARLDNLEGVLGQNATGKAELDVGERPVLDLANRWVRRELPGVYAWLSAL